MIGFVDSHRLAQICIENEDRLPCAAPSSWESSPLTPPSNPIGRGRWTWRRRGGRWRWRGCRRTCGPPGPGPGSPPSPRPRRRPEPAATPTQLVAYPSPFHSRVRHCNLTSPIQFLIYNGSMPLRKFAARRRAWRCMARIPRRSAARGTCASTVGRVPTSPAAQSGTGHLAVDYSLDQRAFSIKSNCRRHGSRPHQGLPRQGRIWDRRCRSAPAAPAHPRRPR